jgi:dTDP-4-amino-4,6-dideoxygalactose transaminase
MKELFVTSPLLPDLNEFKKSLDKIWKSKWVTNNGSFHSEFEQRLAEFLGVEFISVFTNGTLPLIIAMKALDLEGEVITTPYSFIATSNSLIWMNLKPVFVDVDEFGNIDPNKIEEAVNDNTSAILGVHVYGNPCQTEKIHEIADKYFLKVVYDAAHAFNVKKNNLSILLDGDMSTLSFHATKVFNTLEGGALICHSAEMKSKVDSLKNFGIEDEVTVSDFGINGKMDEIRAVYGILNLEKVNDAIKFRKIIADDYRKKLKSIKGIKFFNDIDGVESNYSYFPIFVENAYKMSRDELYEQLKTFGIFSRRYFYPLITDFKQYEEFQTYDLNNARRIADTVLCLPIHTDMTLDDVDRIVEIIK